MELDGLDPDAEFGADLIVGATAGDQSHDLQLSSRQGTKGMDRLEGGSGKGPSAGSHGADRRDDRLGPFSLHDEARGAASVGRRNIRRAVVRTQDDEPWTRAGLGGQQVEA